MKVHGVDDLNSALDKVLHTVEKEIETAYHKIGKDGIELIERGTPVDTGRLRDSYTYTFGGSVFDKPRFSEDAVNSYMRVDKMYIGTNTPYSAAVEFLARNGSAGYFYRGSKEVIIMAERVLKNEVKRGLDNEFKGI